MTAKGPSNGKWRRRSEAGQSLVEFAAGLVVLVILVSGVLDIGRAFMTFVAIENGAGEGAMFAAIHPTWLTASDAVDGGCDSAQAPYENIEYRASHESPMGLVDWNLATVGVITSTIEPGYPITVTVTYSYPLLTAYVTELVGGGILPLRAGAMQMILCTECTD